jgi:hypothetical protein
MMNGTNKYLFYFIDEVLVYVLVQDILEAGIVY